ncbi:PIF1-like helicase-domain-containing protein [Pisolithus albus]|nr:PIF1-like helicase-domain-containing protein [Pisolithus albus]
MKEAVESLRTPSQLRFLFTLLLLEGYPTIPLWEKFWCALAIDHIIHLQDEDLGLQHTLGDISNFLSLSRRKISDFGLPNPIQQTREVADEFNFLHQYHATFFEESEHLVALLNDEQSRIFDTIHRSIFSHDSDCTMFFIEGRPGRGKTFLIKALTAVLRRDSHIVLIVGSSALSATAYQRGCTAHFLFGIPVTDDNTNLVL